MKRSNPTTTAPLLEQLARHGAVIRLGQIEAERAALLETFPDLATLPTLPAAAPAPATNGHATLPPSVHPTVRRRSMSAAERRKVSKRMRAYWAARKAGKAGKAGKASEAGKG